MTAKIAPFSTLNATPVWIRRSPKRISSWSTASSVIFCLRSDVQRVRAHREHRIEHDDADDADHHRAGRREADAGRIALRVQPAVAADQPDQRAEDDRLGQP